MPLESLEPLDRLTSNENIAIATLAIMLVLAIGAIVAQWRARMALEKLQRDEIERVRKFIETLIENFRGDIKNAFSNINEFSETLNKTGADIAIIADRVKRAGT